MRKFSTIFIAAILAWPTFSAAQRVIPAAGSTTTSTNARVSTITKDASGNYYQKTTSKAADKPTGNTFTDRNGNKYPVYQSARGKFYCIRVSKTTGKEYKQYMP
jgi:hypothetical protein